MGPQGDEEMKSSQPAAAAQEAQQEIEETKPNPNGFFADTSDANACSVAVAVRIRPLIGKELREGSKICVEAREEDCQIVIGKDRTFTFDKTFGIDS